MKRIVITETAKEKINKGEVNRLLKEASRIDVSKNKEGKLFNSILYRVLNKIIFIF